MTKKISHDILKWNAKTRTFTGTIPDDLGSTIDVVGKHITVTFVYHNFVQPSSGESYWLYKPHTETTPASHHDIQLRFVS